MLGDVLSAPRFLVDVFSFVVHAKSAFSFQRSFGGKFAWETVRDSPIVNFVSQTMNKHIKTLVIVGKVYVA